MSDAATSLRGQSEIDRISAHYGVLGYGLADTLHAGHGAMDRAYAEPNKLVPPRSRYLFLLPPATIVDAAVIDGLTIAIHANYSKKMVSALRSGRYEHRERRAARTMLAPGDRVLELGGAIGAMAMTCAAIVGAANVVSIEANPELVGHARYNFYMNEHPVTTKNGVARNAADWAGEDERASFYIAEDFWSSSLTNRGNIVRTVSVPVLCLEKEIEAARANVLVCDIEGGEVDLLWKADLSQVEKIIMEVHYGATGVAASNQLVAKLLASGFEVDWVLSGSSVVCLYRGRAPWWKRWDEKGR